MSEGTPSEPPPEAGLPRFTGIFYERVGGALVPLAATVLAFLIGGLVVLITGHNPITAYRAIFNGTGFNWLFPWVTGDERRIAAKDLQETLRVTTPLILTALAVAFAFRAGLFNIGGQGQYWVGFMAALFIGTHLSGLPRPLYVLLGLAAGILGGMVWGGIAGFLRATSGAHEVITTIMLNWVAIFGGQYLYELGGPLQGTNPTLPRSDVIDASAKLWVWWGTFPGLHVGIFIAIAALVVYTLILNRTTLGFGLRAVGFNPDAAAYSGIPVRRSYFLALAIAGGFAGIAGAIDVLGFKYAVDTSDFGERNRLHRHRRRAPGTEQARGHLLRRAPVRGPPGGHVVAQPRPGNLPAGASHRPLDDDPGAGHLLRRRGRPDHLHLAPPPTPEAAAAAERGARPAMIDQVRSTRSIGIAGIAFGLLAFWLALPPFTIRAAAVPILVGLVELGSERRRSLRGRNGSEDSRSPSPSSESLAGLGAGRREVDAPGRRRILRGVTAQR